MPDNADWLATLNYIDFLRDVGRHFSVNRMLALDSVKLRLEREQELSFLEFNYMILQAYDFVELTSAHGCMLQMGGSDQWGNIVNGIDLGRRMANAAALRADLAAAHHRPRAPRWARPRPAPSGSTPTCCSPYDYWQFWRNTEDADVGRFLKLFTVLPLDEIARLAALQGRGDQRGQEDARHRGDRAAAWPRRRRRRRRDRARTFEEGALAESLPTVEVAAAELDGGLGVLAAFVKAGPGRFDRRGAPPDQGRRPAVNDDDRHRREDDAHASELTPQGVIKLSLGKKRHVLLKPV